MAGNATGLARGTRGRQRVGSIALALLVFAGQIKANPLLDWVPVDLTLLTAAAVGLLIFAARVLDGPAPNTVALPVVVWCLLAFGVPFAHNTDYSRTKMLTLFTVTLILAVSPFYLLRSPEDRRVFLFALVGVASFGAVSLVVLPEAPDLYGRVSLVGGDTIGTGRVAGASALVLFLFATLSTVGQWPRLLGVFFSIAFLAGALVTGSRGPVLSAVVALVVVVALAPAFRGRRVRALLGATVLVGAAAVFLRRSENVGFTRVLDFISGDSSFEGEARESLWQSAWNGIVGQPLGHGFGSFVQANDFQIEYPHNLLLELGYEVGWLPTLVFGILVVAAGRRSVRESVDAVSTAMFALFVFSFAGAMVSSDFNGSRLFVVTFFAAFATPNQQSLPCETEDRLGPRCGPDEVRGHGAPSQPVSRSPRRAGVAQLKQCDASAEATGPVRQREHPVEGRRRPPK